MTLYNAFDSVHLVVTFADNSSTPFILLFKVPIAFKIAMQRGV
jgi:hypothetical protein